MTGLQIREALPGNYEQVCSLLQGVQHTHVEAEPSVFAFQERFFEDEVCK